jgi:hypothetical protein
VADPKPRPTISRERVKVMAHHLVDGLMGVNPAAYFWLNDRADISTLFVFIETWLDAQNIEVVD